MSRNIVARDHSTPSIVGGTQKVAEFTSSVWQANTAEEGIIQLKHTPL